MVNNNHALYISWLLNGGYMSTSMFERGGRQTSKKAINVTLLLADSVIHGQVYVSQGQRVQDLINDGRAFIPVGTEEHGKFKQELINKNFIIKLIEADGGR